MKAVFTFQQDPDHTLCVDAFLNDKGALEFVVGDMTVRKCVVLKRDDVGELFNALGKHLSSIADGGAIVEMIEPVERMRVFGEIHAERERQDEKWGGPAHDDEHDAFEWSRFLQRQAMAGEQAAHRQLGPEWRKRFVNIAALAIAAIESIDRQSAAVVSDVHRIEQDRSQS
jgi:hypothetical protein